MMYKCAKPIPVSCIIFWDLMSTTICVVFPVDVRDAVIYVSRYAGCCNGDHVVEKPYQTKG